MKGGLGGPAFPTVFRNDGDLNAMAPNGEVVPPGGAFHLLGMSLRDYFAGQAAACLWHHNFLTYAMNERECELQIANAAALSYRIADAMLKERTK